MKAREFYLEIAIAVGLAIIAAIGVDVVMNSPKADITLEFRYEHHGGDLKALSLPKGKH